MHLQPGIMSYLEILSRASETQIFNLRYKSTSEHLIVFEALIPGIPLFVRCSFDKLCYRVNDNLKNNAE